MFRFRLPVSGVLLRSMPWVFCSLMVAPVASAEIFRWQDAKGVIHYSDRMPPNPTSVQDVSDRLPYLHEVDLPAASQDLDLPKSSPRAATRSASQLRADAQEARLQKQCDKAERDLQRIQSRLRSGYSVAQGNRLRERRRELSDRLYRDCRDRD